MKALVAFALSLTLATTTVAATFETGQAAEGGVTYSGNPAAPTVAAADSPSTLPEEGFSCIAAAGAFAATANPAGAVIGVAALICAIAVNDIRWHLAGNAHSGD